MLTTWSTASRLGLPGITVLLFFWNKLKTTKWDIKFWLESDTLKPCFDIHFLRCHCVTYWRLNKMTVILQTTFFWMKMFVLRLRFYWNRFLTVQVTIRQYLHGWWIGAVQDDMFYLNQFDNDLLTTNGLTGSQWVTFRVYDSLSTINATYSLPRNSYD